MGGDFCLAKRGSIPSISQRIPKAPPGVSPECRSNEPLSIARHDSPPKKKTNNQTNNNKNRNWGAPSTPSHRGYRQNPGQLFLPLSVAKSQEKARLRFLRAETGAGVEIGATPLPQRAPPKWVLLKEMLPGTPQSPKPLAQQVQEPAGCH